MRMSRTVGKLFRSFTENIKGIMLSAFFLIFVMMVLIGASSFFGIERLSKMNQLTNDSYNVLMKMDFIEKSANKVERDIWEHFSGNGWKSFVDPTQGADAKFRMDNEQLDVAVNSSGLLPWSVEVMQGSFTLNPQQQYRLTFDAASTVDRPIQIMIENSNYYNKYHVSVVPITREMEQYSIEFQMNESQDPSVQLVFAFGNVSDNQMMAAHEITLDHISLVEVETGKKLIHNGEFLSKDPQVVLDKTKREFEQAIHSVTSSVTNRPEQKELVYQLNKALDQWSEENEQIIDRLNLSIASSGNLNADQELQTLTTMTSETKSDITQLINQINKIETAHLNNNKEETASIKQLVYGSLILVVVVSLLLSWFIYLYFNRTIIHPIRQTSDWLKQMTEEEHGMMSRTEQLNRSKHYAAIREIRQLYYHLNDYHELLCNQVQLDGLTGLINRKMFDQVIEKAFHQQAQASLLLLDIDHFKFINDTYGHLIGDEVIKQLAEHLREIEVEGALSFRYGGEEFAVWLPHTDLYEAYEIAERLREAVSKTPSPTGKPITISIGVADSQETDLSSTVIIERADMAMYQSKLYGRNRTTLFEYEDHQSESESV